LLKEHSRKRECLSHLVLQMCENNAIELFMSFPFVGVVKEVEIALLSRIEELEPDSRHSYANILYSWYFRRGNYRDGMFQFVLVALVLMKHFRCTCHVSTIRAVDLSRK